MLQLPILLAQFVHRQPNTSQGGFAAEARREGPINGPLDIRSVPTENVVALCDVDANHVARSVQALPLTKQYSDFRKMLETQQDIDAVASEMTGHRNRG